MLAYSARAVLEQTEKAQQEERKMAQNDW